MEEGCDEVAKVSPESEDSLKIVQWKIEKRVLERVGHEMRMKDESLTTGESGSAWVGQEVGRGKQGAWEKEKDCVI